MSIQLSYTLEGGEMVFRARGWGRCLWERVFGWRSRIALQSRKCCPKHGHFCSFPTSWKKKGRDTPLGVSIIRWDDAVRKRLISAVPSQVEATCVPLPSLTHADGRSSFFHFFHGSLGSWSWSPLPPGRGLQSWHPPDIGCHLGPGPGHSSDKGKQSDVYLT